jgi:hypothetical protein
MSQAPLQQLENGITYKNGEYPCRVILDKEREDWFNLDEIIPIITLLNTPTGEWKVKGVVSPTILLNAHDPIRHLYEVALKDYESEKGSSG